MNGSNIFVIGSEFVNLKYISHAITAGIPERNNSINFFLTNQPERYLNPLFGGNLRNFIFEQITANNTDFLKQDIQTQIGLYFPNVIVARLDVIEYPDINQVVVTLKYTIADTNISDQLDIAFN